MKNIFVCVVFVLCIFTTGCVQTTTGIWNKPRYQESIKQFLATEDGDKLIFVGKNHHYIFDNQEALKSILQWNGRSLLKAIFDSKFLVDETNSVKGNFKIICNCNKASLDQLAWLDNMGFVGKEGGETFLLVFDGAIQGQRYKKGERELDNYSTLNEEYRVTVETEHTPSGIVGRLALTPIAIAEDGIATIGLVALMVVATPFAIFDMAKEKNKQAKEEKE